MCCTICIEENGGDDINQDIDTGIDDIYYDAQEFDECYAQNYIDDDDSNDDDNVADDNTESDDIGGNSDSAATDDEEGVESLDEDERMEEQCDIESNNYLLQSILTIFFRIVHHFNISNNAASKILALISYVLGMLNMGR